MTKFKPFVLFIAVALLMAACAPVTINSVPEGAAVYKGEKQVGTTPYKTYMIAWDKEYELRMEDHFPKTVSLDFDEGETVGVKLREHPIIVIESVPTEASLYEKGVHLGETPFATRVDKGHAVELRKDGYYTRAIVVSPRSPEKLSFVLERIPVEVGVETDPSGASVLQGGKVVGKTPYTTEVTELLALDIQLDRYIDVQVTLSPDKPGMTKIVLEKKPVPVVLESTPAGATVLKAGKPVGRTPYRTEIIEPLTLEVQAEKYESAKVTLSAEKPGKTTVTLEAIPEPEPEPEPVEEPAPVVEEVQEPEPAPMPAAAPAAVPEVEPTAETWWQQLINTIKSWFE
jgi:hypothetical protein